MKILFFKLGAIGDVLMTTPLVRQVRRTFPNAKIDYLIGNCASKVLQKNQYIDKIIKFDENIFLEKKIFLLIKLILKIRKKKYDMIYILDKHWIFNLMAFLFGIKKRIGFNRLGKEGYFLTKKIYYGSIKHEIHYYLDLLDNYDKKDIKLDLFIRKETEKKMNLFLKNNSFKDYYVLVNSGGNNPCEKSLIRRIPDNYFKKLVNKYSLKNKVLFLGVSSEYSYYSQFKNNNRINLCGKFNIFETCHILKNAKEVHVTDSGLMHMGSAVGARLVCYFGPTHPLRKAPFGAKVIWKDENKYDDKYDLFGKIVNKKYFEAL